MATTTRKSAKKNQEFDFGDQGSPSSADDITPAIGLAVQPAAKPLVVTAGKKYKVKKKGNVSLDGVLTAFYEGKIVCAVHYPAEHMKAMLQFLDMEELS